MHSKEKQQLQKVAELAVLLTKTAGVAGFLKNLFKKKPKALSLADLLKNQKYTQYLSSQYGNPKAKAKAFARLQKDITDEFGQNITPEAVLHMAEQKKLLEQMQKQPGELLATLADRYSTYAVDNPAKALAGTLAGGYGVTRGSKALGNVFGEGESSKKDKNVVVL